VTRIRPLRFADLAALLTSAFLIAGCADAIVPPEPPPPEAPIFEGVFDSRISGPTGRPYAVRASSAGQVWVTVYDPASIARFPLTTGVFIAPIPVTADPGEVVFTSNGASAIVSTFEGGRLHFINTATGAELGAPLVIGTNAYRLALSSDESRVFVTTVGGMLYAVDRVARTKLDSIQLTGSLQGISRRASDGRLVVSSTGGGLWLIDPATLDVVLSTTIPASAQDVVYSMDGTRIFVGLESQGYVAVHDAATLARTDSIGFNALEPIAPFGLALSLDGSKLLVSSPASGRVGVVDVVSKSVLRTIPVAGTPRRIAFSVIGTRALVANEFGWVDVLR
jgi:YVTN family beta-propeller protein